MTLRLPNGEVGSFEHGDLVGRVWSAAVFVDDPRVSEGHALISHREGSFWLLALRRMLSVNGRSVAEVRLETGVRVDLADGLTIEVIEVAVPATVTMLHTDRLPRMALPSVCSIRGGHNPRLVARFEPDAPCVVWSTGEGWRMRLHGHESALSPETSFVVDGTTFSVALVPLTSAGPGVTLVQGGVHAPLRIVAAHDSVHIHRDDEPVLTLSGVQARILSELAILGVPVAWSVIAGEIWDDPPDSSSLRGRWDVALTRLRGRLRAARIRSDLIRSDGTGNVEMVLYAADVVDDRT